MRMILLGPPGVGKGTQAVTLAQAEQAAHISTGDILRAHVAQGTPLGKAAKEYMDKGLLVPDDVIMGLVKDRLQQPDAQNGYIFDGFPRTAAQAVALGQLLNEEELPLEAVVSLEASDELVVERISGRRTCRECKEVYHVKFSPPKVTGVCDKCGGELYQRDDDIETVVRKRLTEYHTKTAPLIEYYRAEGLLKTVDGTQSVQAVSQAIRKAIG